MKKNLFVVLSFLVLVASCKKEVDIPEEPEVVINNNYKVTTLTESFPGSGGLTVGKDGFIYVANYGDALSNANGTKVRKIDPESGAIEEYASGFSGASGCAFDQEGNLYQASIRGNFISKVTPNGLATTLTKSQISNPVGVVVNSMSEVFVCNCGSNTVVKITEDGATELFARGSLFNCPNGITIDEEDNLYVVNFNNNKVVKITPAGEASTIAETPNNQNGHVVFANNKLFIAARGAHQLLEVGLDGTVSVAAGNGTQGNDDGSSKESNFYIPNGIGASPDGSKIYMISRLVGIGSALNPVVVRVIELN